MKSFGMTLGLKDGPGVVEAYKEYHRAVWPEVVEGLKGVGITQMRIFLRGRRLFMCMETVDDFDLDRDFPRYMESQRAQEWDTLMRTYQEPVPEARPDEWWASMEQVYDLEGRLPS